MNIGIDIDNVITDFDKTILKYFLIEDKLKRNSGIINPKARHINHGMFDWSEEEIQDFYIRNMETMATELTPRRDCKKYMDKLLCDGHDLFLISHRVPPHYTNAFKTTTEWLKKYKINYTKLIISKSADKTNECKEFNIDLMIDDRADQLSKMKAKGINTLLMLTRYNKREKGDLKFASSWKNLYQEITKWGN